MHSSSFYKVLIDMLFEEFLNPFNPKRQSAILTHYLRRTDNIYHTKNLKIYLFSKIKLNLICIQ